MYPFIIYTVYDDEVTVYHNTSTYSNIITLTCCQHVLICVSSHRAATVSTLLSIRALDLIRMWCHKGSIAYRNDAELSTQSVKIDIKQKTPKFFSNELTSDLTQVKKRNQFIWLDIDSNFTWYKNKFSYLAFISCVLPYISYLKYKL